MSMPYMVVVECRDFGAVVSTYGALSSSSSLVELVTVSKSPTGVFRFTFRCISEDAWKVEDALSCSSHCGSETGGSERALR